METILVPVWMIVLSTGTSANVEVPGQHTSYESCLAAAAAYAGRTDRVSATCVQRGAMQVPLPQDVTQQLQKLKQYEEADKARK